MANSVVSETSNKQQQQQQQQTSVVPSSEQEKKLPKDKETSKSDLKDLTGDTSKCTGECITNVYFKQYVKRLHSVVNKSDDVSEDKLRVRLQVELDRHQLTSLKTYTDDATGQTGVQAAYAALEHMLLTTIRSPDTDLFAESPWHLPFTIDSDVALVIILILLVTVLIIKVFSHSWTVAHSSVFFMKLLFILFTVSIFWNWAHLYQAEKARRLSSTMKGVPEECKPKQQQGFLATIVNWFALPSDTCAVYHQQLLIDPFWEVPPTRALAVTVTKFGLEPVELIAGSVRRCFVALLDGLPVHLWPIVLGAVGLFCPFAMLVWRGYTLSIPFVFSLGPSNNSAEQANKQLKAENDSLKEINDSLKEIIKQLKARIDDKALKDTSEDKPDEKKKPETLGTVVSNEALSNERVAIPSCLTATSAPSPNEQSRRAAIEPSGVTQAICKGQNISSSPASDDSMQQQRAQSTVKRPLVAQPSPYADTLSTAEQDDSRRRRSRQLVTSLPVDSTQPEQTTGLTGERGAGDCTHDELVDGCQWSVVDCAVSSLPVDDSSIIVLSPGSDDLAAGEPLATIATQVDSNDI